VLKKFEEFRMIERKRIVEKIKLDNISNIEISMLPENVNNNENNPREVMGNVCFIFDGYMYTYSGVCIKNILSNSLFKRRIPKSGEKEEEWVRVETYGKEIPGVRTMSYGVVIGNYFYLFGGHNTPELKIILNGFWRMDITTYEWKRMSLRDSNGNIFDVKYRSCQLMFCDSFTKKIFLFCCGCDKIGIMLLELNCDSINNEIISNQYNIQTTDYDNFGFPSGPSLLFPFDSDNQLAFILCENNTTKKGEIFSFDMKNKNALVVNTFPNEITLIPTVKYSCFQISKNECLVVGGRLLDFKADRLLCQDEIFYFELVEGEGKKLIKWRNLGTPKNIISKSFAGVASDFKQSFGFMFGGTNKTNFVTKDLVIVKKTETPEIILFKRRLVEKRNQRFYDCRIRFCDQE
jgi:hypothetical protein